MSYYMYNNEAIGAIGVAAVLRHCNTISYSKALLILPFLFHEDTVSVLRRSNSVLRSIEEMMMKKIINFGNFNARYYSLLPVSINTIMLLNQMREITIDENNIYSSFQSKIDLSNSSFGKRTSNIIKAAPKLAEILSREDDQSLYLKLRIQL